MKGFIFYLNKSRIAKYLLKDIEDSSIIRNKIDILKFWIFTLNCILFVIEHEREIIEEIVEKEDIRHEINSIQIYILNNIKRIFYIQEKKIISVYFPFDIKDIYSQIKVKDIEINLSISSDLKKLIKENEIRLESLEDFLSIEYLIEESVNKGTRRSCIKILKHLLLSEDGYIRFDIDEENADSTFHPMHHFDIFYTNTSTFKLGNRSNIEIKDFVNLLDKDAECHYIIPFSNL